MRISFKTIVKPAYIFYAAFLLLPFVMGGIFYRQLPEQVAVHWNAENQPDNFVHKAFALFAIPAFMLLLNGVAQLLITHDPKKENIRRTKALLVVMRWFLVLLPILVQAIVILQALKPDALDIGGIVMVFMGLLLAVIGNYLPKCQPNFTMGIRLPWTLADEDNWRRTHRMAGPVWLIGGLLFSLLSVTPFRFAAFIIILFMAIIPGVYSFIVYRRKHMSK